QKVAIVNPGISRAVTEGEVGEIWLSGPSVASGYWGHSDDSFRARRIDDDPRIYLRTGDLGFIHENELVVTGRLKDLIIIRGKNHAPQDIERTAEHSHPGMRPGCCAAFTLEGVDGGLVIAGEL